MDKLFKTIQSLSEPYEIQITLYPKFVVVADELILDLDEVLESEKYASFLNNINDQQKESIKTLDEYIINMNNKRDKYLWTIEALRDSKEWETIRNLANNVMDVLQIERRPPDELKNNAWYINEDHVVENK